MKRVFVEPFLYDIYDAVELAKRYGLGLEFYFSSERVDKYSMDGVPKELNTVNELSIHGPINDLSFGSSDVLIRKASAERLRKTLGLVADKTRAEWLVIHMGLNPLTYWSDKLVNEWVERAADVIIHILSDYSKVVIHIENAYEKDPNHLKRFIDKIYHNKTYITLDIGHAKVYSNHEPEEWIETLAPYIREIHLHNNYGNFDDHLPIGEGAINYEKIFKHLEIHVGEPILTLEPINENNLKKDLAWLKERGFI